jgi:4-hydroxy-tetrahydrodipicolinate reductase
MIRAMLRVLIAGVTGWTGVPLAAAVGAADDLELAGGIARRGADHASVEEALAATEADVLVDYTKPDVVRGHVDAALAAGMHVVVGTSGLTADDYAELDAAARAAGRGVIAAGNFSVLAATLLHAATLAARHVSHWEVIDYGSAGKPDVPSGTARELAERLEAVRAPGAPQPPDAVAGPREARGATVGGAQVHSLRLASFVVSTEVIFGLPDERLSIRHDAGGSPAPYVAGTLLAARALAGRTGLTRGLDTLLAGE